MARNAHRRTQCRWEAAEFYRDARSVHNLWMGAGDVGIRLFEGEVVENDGPGAGRSDQEGIEPFLELSGGMVVRKLLRLEDARTGGVQLAFVGRERPGHQSSLRFTVNGRDAARPPSPQATPNARQYWALPQGEWNWSRWYYVDVPPEYLRAGDNTITVEADPPSPGWQLMVADYRDFHKGMTDPVELPHTSSISRDGGETWEEERGEYVLRLALKRFRQRGEVVGPVIDVAEGDAPVKSPCQVQTLRLDWEADTPAGTSIRLQVRTASQPLAGEEEWSEWVPAESGRDIATIRGRYAQWRAELTTGDPTATPTLTSVQLEAMVREIGASGTPLRVVSARGADMARSSVDFPPEDYACTALRELRERFELDAVVAGASTEFDRIQRLMRWAYRIPLGNCTHFPWNTLEWVTLERDEAGDILLNEYTQRRRDVMCLYPNVVLVAACMSFGIPARHVNFHSEGMTGHEIAEVWSNDFGKWVHLDATRDYYWYDPKTQTPLDTGEVHGVLTARLEEVESWQKPYLFHQDLQTLDADLPIAFRDGEYEHSVEEGALHLLRTFCHFRLVPRLNVFSQPRPLPVSQGTEVWAWNGYLNWADDEVPPLVHFEHHTNRRPDFYPAMNQTEYVVERDGDELSVHLATNTPGFSCFLVRCDGHSWRESDSPFTWSLHDGLNVLEMRARNGMGVEGPVSSLAVSDLEA